MVQTYGDVAFFVWGRVGRLITDAALTVTQFGFCVGYIVFLSASGASACLAPSRPRAGGAVRAVANRAPAARLVHAHQVRTLLL